MFSGWPPSLDTPDLLFLIPVPWVGPVWSPVAISVALVGFGLATAGLERAGRTVALDRRHWAAGLGGGLLVILSWTVDAGRLIDGGLPGPYAWPISAAGMLLTLAAAAHALARAGRRDPGATG